MTALDRYEILAAIELVERELPDFAWSFARITNDHHALPPFGVGVSMYLSGHREGCGEIHVWQKHRSSALAAARIAIERARRRIAGEADA